MTGDCPTGTYDENYEPDLDDLPRAQLRKAHSVTCPASSRMSWTTGCTTSTG
jgi:hypothetical protein